MGFSHTGTAIAEGGTGKVPTMSRLSNLFLLTLLFGIGSGIAQAARGTIDCPRRRDFQACYLTTENPQERNLATLLRGLEVEVLGRASNGRWKVRLPRVEDYRVQTHDDWPAGGPAVGFVNPDFLVLPQGSPTPLPASVAPGAWPSTASLGSAYGSPSAFPGSLGGGLLGVISALGGSRGVPSTTLPASLPVGDGTSGVGPQSFPASSGGLTGSAFLQQTAGLSQAAREQAILQAVRQGHIPSFLGNFQEVTLRHGGHEARVRVAPDYLAIGTDQDFVRMPMFPATAQQIADSLGCTLPRPKLVDAIWSQAQYKLAPRPLTAGSSMGSNDYYRRANQLIDQELAGRPPGPLTAGDKKDIVLTNRLASNPGKVAIYGWHRTSGSAIQPLTTVHGATYVDYSHGLRLVSREMVVDGRATTVDAVLQDPSLAGLLTNEVPVRVLRYPTQYP